jgi:hypothetical protein
MRIAVLASLGGLVAVSACDCGSLTDARDHFCAQRPDVCDAGTDSGVRDSGSPDAGADAGPADAACILDAGTGVVSGTVTNLQTGNPVAGATVTYSLGMATANGSGDFSLPNVPACSWVFTADSNGYLARPYTLAVDAGVNNALDPQLSTSGKLIGHVKVGGMAFAGATVRAQGGQIPFDQTVTTDSSGLYNQGYIPIGSYSVTCDAGTPSTSPATITTGITTTLDFNL